MPEDIGETAKFVSSCLQLGILLEVSAPKPGNVNRRAGFQCTRYEHFLASAVAVEPSLEILASRGAMVFNGRIGAGDIGVGEIIRRAVLNVKAWQHGGNTLLGTILLLSPVAAAAGITLAERQELEISKMRRNIRRVVESTTPHDAVAVYDAINVAKPAGLAGKAPTLDVADPVSKERIMDENITLYDVFRISAPYDSISREWTENYEITFELGLPYFSQQIIETHDLNTAIVHTFLKILSAVPDTLIMRKVGLDAAKEVSRKACEALESGGVITQRGVKKLSILDGELRESANEKNPGTTADIIAAVLSISILKGYRP